MSYTLKIIAVALAIVLCVSTLLVHAQSARPAFEVASIKPAQTRGFMNISPSGQVSVSGMTVKGLLTFAYKLRDDQVLGGPAWIATEVWAIQAKAPDGRDMQDAEVIRQMLQSLLQDRFQLKVHNESRDFSVYLLSVGKNGPKVSPYQEQSAPPRSPPGPPLRGLLRRNGDDIAATGVRMSSLASFLGQFIGRPVLDQTGLEGEYDFKLHWLPAPPTQVGGPDAVAGDPAGPSIFTAIQDIGLKLDAVKAPMEVLVIDSVSKPSEN
jgi:uncharacterized protein (TIGR03435 family)